MWSCNQPGARERATRRLRERSNSRLPFSIATPFRTVDPRPLDVSNSFLALTVRLQSTGRIALWLQTIPVGLGQKTHCSSRHLGSRIVGRTLVEQDRPISLGAVGVPDLPDRRLAFGQVGLD